MQQPRAIIWDFDGTLVNTEPLWGEVEREILAPFGVYWDDDVLASHTGQASEITARQMAEAVGRPELADQWYDELHDRLAVRLRQHLPYQPGAERIVDEAAAAGIRQCIVTASNDVIMGAVRDTLPSAFEFLITADDVTRTKPDPEAYLMAFDRLGLAATDCLILEDSITGSTAALAAVGVVFAVPDAQSLAAAHRMHVSDDALRTTDLDRLCATWRDLRGRA